MKQIWLPLLAIGAYAGYQLWRKSNASDHIRYAVKRVRFIGTSLTSTRLEIDLAINNPTDVALDFDKFIGKLKFQTTTLVDIQYAGVGKPIALLPGRDTIITIPVTINHLGAAMGIKDAVTAFINKTELKGIQVSGLLYAAGFEIPIAQSINLNFSKQAPAVGSADCAPCIGVLN